MPVAESDLDLKVMKLVKEAVRGLDDLEKEIDLAVKNLHKRQVDPAKAEKAAKKVLAFMAKFTSVTKLQGSKAYDQLSPAAQAQVDWIDKLMGQLLKLQDDLRGARKQAEFDPEKKYTILVKAASKVFAQMPSAPRGTGTLIKEIKKGIEVGGPEGGLIALLPMALLLWMIWDTITRGLKARPKS